MLLNRRSYASLIRRSAQLVVAGLMVLAVSSILRLEKPIRIRADETYQEVLVPALPRPNFGEFQTTSDSQQAPITVLPQPPLQLLPIPEALSGPSASCNCAKAAGASDDSPIYISAFGGASYFDTTSDVSFGGMYGLTLAAPVYERFEAMGTGMINNYGSGTQFSGSLGGYITSDYYGTMWDRLGASFFVDQFTDTGLGSPYLAQARYLVSYQLLPAAKIGVQYMQPLTDSTQQTVLPGGTLGTPLRTDQVIQSLLMFGGTTLGFGYVGTENSLTYSVSQTRQITDRMSANFSATYDERVGLWTGFVGLQIDLSPRPNFWLFSDATSDKVPGDIVRGAVSVSTFSESLIDILDPPATDTQRKQQEIINRTNMNQQLGRLHQQSRPHTSTPTCPGGLIRTGGKCFCRGLDGIAREVPCP